MRKGIAVIERTGISIPADLLNHPDAFAERKGCSNRSEAIRDLVKGRYVEEEWRGRMIRRISDRLIATKGVKHGKLVMTATGESLA